MTDCEYEDVAVCKIYDIQLNNQTYSLTIGHGTHGSSHHHKTICVFYFVGSELKQHSSFLDGESSSYIVSARRDKPYLKYDEETQTISHKEFDFSDGIRFAMETGKILILQVNTPQS